MQQKLIEERLQTLTEENFNRLNQNPWHRCVLDPYRPGHRDAFLGNGLIGVRIPMEGEPSVYPCFSGVKMSPGGTLMHGVWNENGILPVFNFMGLRIMHGRMVFRRDSGTVLNYRQELDWKTGTTVTECDWVHWGGNLHIKTTVWLSRTQKNIGFTEIELTSDYDTTFALVDLIDGSFIPDITDVKIHLRSGGAIPKVVMANIGNCKVAAASAVSVNGEPVSGNVTLKPGGFERMVYCPVKKGITVRICKCGSMLAGKTSRDLINTAATAAVYALENREHLRAQHIHAWETLWESRIETGHSGVQALMNSALYQLYSNLDESQVSGVPGPCGLSCNAWFNHIFHDADSWTLPVVSLFNPDMAKNYLRYRIDTLPGAKRNAQAMGLSGARYAWESGESGDELIPGLIYCEQIHINAAVVQGLWRCYLNSGDESCLPDIAKAVFACADFFADRVVFNKEKDRYEIHAVCCPDEFSGLVDNNAYTNLGAKYTLLLAEKIALRLNLPVNPAWRSIADRMYLPIDPEKKIVLEHEKYEGNEIKQADAILCFYPLDAGLPDDYRKNTNEYYLSHYEKEKIMMSSAIHGLVAAKDRNPDLSWKLFLDLLPHFRTEYLMASESPRNETISLLTGLGGMIQMVLMGWGGLNISEESLEIRPSIPEQVRWLNIRGFWYKGKKYDLEIAGDNSFRLSEKEIS